MRLPFSEQGSVFFAPGNRRLQNWTARTRRSRRDLQEEDEITAFAVFEERQPIHRGLAHCIHGAEARPPGGPRRKEGFRLAVALGACPLDPRTTRCLNRP